MNRRIMLADVQKGADPVPMRVKIEQNSDGPGSYARSILDKMRELGFDDVSIDPEGNVVGCLGNSPQSSRMIYIP